jgi:chromosome partitioning protein
MVAFTIASQKGGVGKTTVALNLAHALARRGWRTLVVDTDPQGAIGLSLSKKLSSSPGLLEYASQASALSKLIVKTKLKELMLLPVGRVPPDDAMGFQSSLADGDVFQALHADLDDQVDIVMYDTPSGFGGATLGALRVSAFAVCPVQAEPIAARSVLTIFDVLGSLRDRGAVVQLAGVLLTMLQTKDRSSLAVAEDLWKRLPGNLIFETTVPRDAAFLEASAAGVPVGLLRRRPPPVAMIFDQLAAEVEARTHLEVTDSNEAPIALVD